MRITNAPRPSAGGTMIRQTDGRSWRRRSTDTMSQAAVVPFQMERLGIVMQSDPAIPEEAEGVLNPGAARGPDGELYLFPRVVGRGNYSRIGIARVRFDAAGNPAGVTRLGYALEPREPYELRPYEGTGGCEDPRVTYVEPYPDPRYDVFFDAYHNKNGSFFPEAIRGPHGQACLALVHRPVYENRESAPKGIADPHPSIWLSYCPLEDA